MSIGHEIGRGSLGVVASAATSRELSHQCFHTVKLFAVLDNAGERVPESVGRQDESLLLLLLFGISCQVNGVALGRGDAGTGKSRVPDRARHGQSAGIDALVADAGLGVGQAHHFRVFDIFLHDTVILGHLAKLAAALVGQESRISAVGDDGKGRR